MNCFVNVHVKVHETRSHAHPSADEDKVMTRKQKAENKTQEATETSPKKTKQENNDNGNHGNGKRSGDVTAEFEEFYKSIEGQLSVEQMREILELNSQDSSGTDVAVVTRGLVYKVICAIVVYALCLLNKFVKNLIP